MTSTRRCKTEASFISTVTEMLGYCPSESLVLLPLTGNEGAATLRFDLPPRDRMLTRDALDAWVNQAIGIALRLENVTALALIVFADERVASAPRPELIRAFGRGAGHSGLRLFAPVFRARNAWGRYDADVCGGERPLRGLRELGRAGELPMTAPQAAARDHADTADALSSDGAARLPADTELVAAFDRMLSEPGGRLHPDDLDRVSRSVAEQLVDPTSRDTLLVRIAFGTGAARSL
ncbi:MAG: DUF4192 family protein, partial [Pseudoclavibacter sp.]